MNSQRRIETIWKCHYGVKQVEFTVKLSHQIKFCPKLGRFKFILAISDSSNRKKALQQYLELMKDDNCYIPRIAEKLKEFQSLLKAKLPINITSNLTKTLTQ